MADGSPWERRDAEAAEAARELLDRERRHAAVAGARAALVDHLGPLTTQGLERTARLMLSMAGNPTMATP
jgi:hypothetical protein